MEININCDLGEKSKHHSTRHDPELLKIVNSANIACGFHAGDEDTMRNTIEISKNNNVSIGAHPSFNDPENFGRKRHYLPEDEIKKLIIDQYEILENIAVKLNTRVTHIKPHGALINMACEDLNLSRILAETIYNIDKNLIYLVPTGSMMERAARKFDMKIACEIFADRNYEDDGNLVSRSKSNAIISNPDICKQHVLEMVENQSLSCLSGKRIKCEIDSICIHGDNIQSLETAIQIKKILEENNICLKPLSDLKKFL